MGVVLEETDETLYWLEILDETEIFTGELIQILTREANELVSIFVASLNKAKGKKG